MSGLVDWWLAERTARAVAGTGPRTRIREESLVGHAEEATGAVVAHTGLVPLEEPPRAEVVDRPEWVQANLSQLRVVAIHLEDRVSTSLAVPGPVGGGLRAVAGLAAGVEIGVVSGMLAQRVLGQYDIALVGPVRPSRLLFVAPNLAEAQRRLGVDRERFLRWVALHEATHAVQFTAVPWLREHLGGLVGNLLESAEPTIDLGRVKRLVSDPAGALRALGEGSVLEVVLGPDRAATMRRIEATMALVEGYSEHVMDEAGGDFGDLRERMDRRRADRGPVEAVIARLLGFEVKLRQYRRGKAFCDAVVAEAGIASLNRAWESPELLPGHAELDAPERWLRRVS